MRRYSAWLAAFVMMVAVPLISAPNAAAAEDSVDSWTVNFVVQENGDVSVREELVYRFGSSDRHGIYRLLVTREPFDDKNDRIYEIEDIQVSSPDAPDKFVVNPKGKGRERDIEIKVGDPDVTIRNKTATYVLEYRMTGTLRSFADHDEFYWNVLTPRDPMVRDVRITVEAPGGITMANCFVGPKQSTTACDSAVIDSAGKAEYRQDQKAADHFVTIGAGLQKGAVADATPNLEPKANAVLEWAKTIGILAALFGGLYFGFKWLNKLLLRGSGDYEFVDVAPGNIPADYQTAPTKRTQSRNKTIVPVRFNPPDLPIGLMAGVRDQVTSGQLSALLQSMAVKGIIGLRATKTESKAYAKLVDPSKVEYPYERLIVDQMFLPHGYEEIELSDPDDQLREAVVNLNDQLKSDAISEGLLTAKRGAAGGIIIHVVVAIVIAIALSPFLPSWAVGLAMIIPFFAGSNYVGLKWRNFATARGQAYWYQLKGFEEYLKTAEADQLRFEEGEDIFSKYLPWATLVGQTKKFTRLCRELVEQGRMAEPNPAWYYGGNFSLDLEWDSISSHMSDFSSSDSSSFAGGSSGGGGGGGGSGSW